MWFFNHVYCSRVRGRLRTSAPKGQNCCPYSLLSTHSSRAFCTCKVLSKHCIGGEVVCKATYTYWNILLLSGKSHWFFSCLFLLTVFVADFSCSLEAVKNIWNILGSSCLEVCHCKALLCLGFPSEDTSLHALRKIILKRQNLSVEEGSYKLKLERVLHCLEGK